MRRRGDLQLVYDAIVIGSGISGLAAAARLVSRHKKVLLIEKQERLGGYFSGFVTENGDKLDYAISYVLSCGENEVVNKFLKELGLQDRLQFIKLNKTDDIYLPNRHLTFEGGKEEFRKILCNEFPDAKEEIDHLIDWLTLFQEGAASQGSAAMKFFFNYFRQDFERFLDKNITNKELKAVLALRIQADPASLMIMAGFLVECFFNGMYYPVGGAQRFSDILGEYIRENGGVIKCSTEIVGFETHEGKVLCAVSQRGERFYADSFVFNGDVLSLFKNYLPDAILMEKEIKKINNRVIGHSSLSIYLVVEDYDLSRFQGGRVYWSDTYDIFGVYRLIEGGRIPDNYIVKLHFPCKYDTTLTNGNRQLIRIETDIYYNPELDSEDKYLCYAEDILNKIEASLLVDLHKHIKFKRVITPIEFKRLFGHSNASGTGWAHTTFNTMISKFSQKTPYSNLYIAGQWGEFGSGLRQLVLSSEKTTNYI